MNKTQNKKYYYALAITIIISFLAIYPVDFLAQNENNKWLEIIRFLTPGIVFSIFFLYFQRKYIGFIESVGYFLALMICYILAFWFGIYTNGVGSILSGAFGAIFIGLYYNYIHNKKTQYLLDTYIIAGSVAPLIGYLFPYLLKVFLILDIESNMGVWFGIIIILWQLAVGFVYIKELKNAANSGT